MTRRLYLEDSYLSELDTEVVECRDGWCRLAATLFHPGGGGQPCDRGELIAGEVRVPITEMREDEAGLWHGPACPLAPGQRVHGIIDWTHRHAVMRHHALLHIVNTIALRDYGARITGAQIGPGRSRIDLQLTEFTRERLPEFEARVNDVITRDLALTTTSVPEADLARRPELIRTLNVRPPVVDGNVRVVEIVDFDAQACGGTHVHSTGEIGRARLVRFDNKGRDNKRLYWETD
jgi:misacylated tRNA(Ala) deacylase